MRRQSRLHTRGEREGREDQTAGQHARAAHSSDPSDAADGPGLFQAAGIRSGRRSGLAFEEVVAEKIRAAAQRSKVRDLHDLSEIAVRVLDRDIIRSLAVLKLWDSDGPNLDYGRFRERITGTRRL
jgi:hypothetical protein